MTPVEPNDPTRSGPPIAAGQGASLSRGEIEQLCLKAARGAGLAWGLAEEAGFAAAWLAMRGLDGPGALLAQLTTAEGRAWDEICPVVTAATFSASGAGQLCPIALGSALCDHVGLPDAAMTACRLQVGPVTYPILLLPFLADVAGTLNMAVRFTWAEGMVAVTPAGKVTGDTGALAAQDTLNGTLSAADPEPGQGLGPIQPFFVAPQVLAALNGYAMRTVVPTSEASRAGAGAGRSDND